MSHFEARFCHRKKNIILTFYRTILKKKKGHNCEEKRLQFSIDTWQDVFEKTHKHASVRLAVVCVCVCVCIAAAAQNQTTRIIYMLRPYANEARGELITAADLSSVLIYESHSLRWVSVQIHSSSVFCWSDLIWSWSQSINGLIYEWAAADFLRCVRGHGGGGVRGHSQSPLLLSQCSVCVGNEANLWFGIVQYLYNRKSITSDVSI